MSLWRAWTLSLLELGVVLALGVFLNPGDKVLVGFGLYDCSARRACQLLGHC
jgi:hypothetical protein